MNSTKYHIKSIIARVIQEDREPLKDILAHDNTEDVQHATHLAMAGGEQGGPEAENLVKPVDHVALVVDASEDYEAENLVLPVDHAAGLGGDKTTQSPEVIDHSTGKVETIDDRAWSLSETRLRKSIRNILIKTL